MGSISGARLAALAVMLRVPGEPEPGKLPTFVGMEEVPVRVAEMTRRRRQAAAAKHHLVDHKLAVVLADGAIRLPEAGVGTVGAGSPLPSIAVPLMRPGLPNSRLHLELRRQPGAGPACVCIGFVPAHVANGRVEVQGREPAGTELPPRAVQLAPVERGRPGA